MSKSILAIDTPESCAKCPLFSNVYTDMTCRVNRRTIDYPFPDNRVSDWCPLKKIPTKYAERDYTPIETKQYMEGYEDGYNDCIDNILKERDENG